MSNATGETINIFGNTGDPAIDAVWTLLCAFIIFTMQSGFALLESGMVSRKNESNIMVKNVVDITVGGTAYWMYGFAFAFGEAKGTNEFTGVGYFFTDTHVKEGYVFTREIFQLSFATTATTIVSGAMAERVRLQTFVIFCFFNVVTYCFPAHWIWSSNGWLAKLGCIDIAGCSVVHMVGGSVAIVAAIMLGPRYGRFDRSVDRPPLSSPSNVMLGTFMLWWGWLAFNCGSTWGVTGGKWLLSSRAAVVTMNGAFGGGIFAIFYCYVIRRRKFKGILDIPMLSTGVLSGLVGITAICAITRPWEGFIIGIIGGAVGIGGVELVQYLKIDDPVGCIGVHYFAGIWGMIAVAFFAEHDPTYGLSYQHGIFRGGNAKLLGVQLAACCAVTVWAAGIAFIVLLILKYTIGLRVTLEDEIEGADLVEHGIKPMPLMEGNHAFGSHVPNVNAAPGVEVLSINGKKFSSTSTYYVNDDAVDVPEQRVPNGKPAVIPSSGTV